MNRVTADPMFRFWAAKTTSRVALGLVWIYEGLMPKTLFVSPSEMALVAQSGFGWPTPQAVLALLGLGEMGLGLWLLSGKAERAAVSTASLIMILLAGLVCWVRPAALVDPFGGISKNLGLLACAAVVWLLVPPTQKARQPAV